MKTFEQEAVSERFSKLPEAVRYLITSEDMGERIKKVTDDIGIEGDKKNNFIQQITLVSVGLATAHDFSEYIQDELNLEPGVSNTVEQTVAETIFTPIKQALLKALEGNTSTQEGGNTPPASGTMEPSGSTADPYTEAR